MNERKAIIGPYNLGWIKAANISLNHKAFLEYLPKVDFESLIYSSLIQCGASQFEVDPIFIDKIPQNEFIKKRFRIAPKKVIKIRNLVYMSFYNLLKSQAQVDELHRIINFIADLLIAVERKCAVISFKGIPDIKDLRSKLPAELYLPIYTLLNSFQEISMVTPIPKVSASREQVERFREILESNVYANYMEKHSLLGSSSKLTNSTLKSLNSISKNVVNKFTDSVKLKKISVSLLSTSANLIETIWGKLPGSVANFAIRLFSSIDTDKRVVVYQTDSIDKELIISRINSYVETVPYQKWI